MLREISVFFLISLLKYPNFFICFTRIRLGVGYSGPSTESDKNIDVLIRLRLVSDIISRWLSNNEEEFSKEC